ncbi:Autoinducer 2 import ATP-binding protein LsrA [Anaerobiospirillum thomasii]|uniref:Autoinducer 2 import ATP-binding protein LsrA n=1 Tax=Anaerobiospirillum thomasii TaxID=179995 RepID=A0A2X0VEJ3_9GAMM|nr:sugar ABC transporter ATP-binding protein [Anaerobiospirillum thomasii]SPT69322.1 Autoinducer 2 import ATP-binding protein LsrA [Anaerobiospirillum thomasii]SPT72113.1 Autoinducer 2 import ATP-binding protein LsrA [Anaerobiospirillum thomasii]
MSSKLLEAQNIYKSFGLNQVLKGISLSVDSGEVLAIIGGNGAGKSTLMKIFMGIYQQDTGDFLINGTKIAGGNSPTKAMKLGIYMVPQEPLIFPHMSILDNILIGFEGKRSDLVKKLKDVYEQIECKIDLNRLGMSLSIAEQQMVELMRGLMRESKVLILDEPTSALTFDEVNTLYRIVRDLKAKGIGIIYITHRMAEVFELATSIAIMSDGKITLHGPTSEFTREMLVQALLPKNTEKTPKKEVGALEKKIIDAMPVLELENFSGYGFKDISFNVYQGEVLGIAGVVGAGRTELAMTIFGKEQPLGGTVKLLKHDITGLSTPEVIKAGINYVPEDRRLNGLFSIASVAANTTSALLNYKLTGNTLLKTDVENNITDKYIKDFRIKVTSRYQEAGSLSGGNQQKIVIARALSTMPKLVILDEPTRGIDAGARGDVYSIIEELKSKGVSIVLISSDMEEIIELADRAIVFCRGRISAELPKERINQQELTSASFGIVNNDSQVKE